MNKPEDSGLERDYCAGLLSLREMADIYGISEGAIRKRAKKNNWVRRKNSGTQVRKKGTQKKEMRTTEEKAHRVKNNPLVAIEEKNEGSDENNSLPPELSGLSQQQLIFAEHAGTGKTRVEAYRLAGYVGEGNTAYVNASRMLRNAKVARAVRYFRDRHHQRYTAELDEVVDQLVSIIRADPNSLTQYRRVNCRYCWGDGHHYQWRDEDEFDRAAAKAAANSKPSPDDSGGVGFVSNMDPNPDCPRCNGEGEGEMKVADTRDLERNELAYFLGVKEGKFGLEVITESKQAARAQLLKILEIGKGRLAAAGDGDEPDSSDGPGMTKEEYRQARREMLDEDDC